MKAIRHSLLALTAFALSLPLQAADVFKLDGAHTTVSFTITHLLISEVGGRFNDVAGEITFADGAVTGAKATIQAASVDTGNEGRDKHLRNPDFFEVEKYPTITFESTKVEKDGDKFAMTGKFTMHGVTKEIRLPVTVKGPIQDPWGKTRLAVSTELTLSRKDYGMDKMTPAVGDEVRIKISAQGVKQ
ncbi:MAG: Protein YceI [Verrucomicrobiae bacterium]|nr:Protein YceI [Verrucomicrobiae bacterium]